MRIKREEVEKQRETGRGKREYKSANTSPESKWQIKFNYKLRAGKNEKKFFNCNFLFN